MDWPRARTILLVAFALVNAVLAYSMWGPSGAFPSLGAASHTQVVEQVRATLAVRGINLPPTVTVPDPPSPMRFLHVEYRPTLPFDHWSGESFDVGPAPAGLSGPRGEDGREYLRPVLDPETRALIFQPEAAGPAFQAVSLENRHQVQQMVEQYLKQEQLLPSRAILAGYQYQAEKGRVTVEYVPTFDDLPVFSGYVRVEVSSRGVESVRLLWVEPKEYTKAPPKAVRPATEALLRLAGRLENSVDQPRTITDVQLGYYANRTLTGPQPDGVNGWDTVPVWRIALDSGEVYYVNGFNGEWES